jgi:hypothetical protein
MEEFFIKFPALTKEIDSLIRKCCLDIYKIS